jgi:hypothetical protein
MPNALCYDNLVVPQNEIANDRVDLIYFDAGSIASYLQCAAPLSGRRSH